MITKLDQLFGSKTRVKMLEFLLAYPDSSFYLRELVRKTGVSFGSVYKELENLRELGLVIEEKRGRFRFFKINKSSALFEDMKRLFLKTESLGGLLKQTLKSNKIKYAVIFGSIARGEEITNSDIDLLIIGAISEEQLLHIIQKSEKQLNREINYILWSKDEFVKRAKSKHHLLAEMVKNPVIWLIGDENEFRKTIGE